VRELSKSPSIVFTKPFLEKATPSLIGSFSSRLEMVLRYFPEIRGEIKIGLTNVHHGLASTELDGKRMLKKISFPPLKRVGLPSRFIIGHELMHLVQVKQKKSIPGTERACDLFTLARLPPKYIDHLPVYLAIPKMIRVNWEDRQTRRLASVFMHELAIEAILSRRTIPRYIIWWENQIVEHIENGHPLGRYLQKLC